MTYLLSLTPHEDPVKYHAIQSPEHPHQKKGRRLYV